MLVFASCNQKSSNRETAKETSMPEVGKMVIQVKIDTSIRQAIVRRSPGVFQLHTYIVTGTNQVSKYGSEMGYSDIMYGGQIYFPYENAVIGSYAHIKQVKKKEYDLAAGHFNRMKTVEDSVKTLNDLKVQDIATAPYK